jgi:transposase
MSNKKQNNNGNPSKNIPKCDNNHIESKDDVRQNYSPEFRQQVLDIWNSGVYETAAECARNYSINENTLYNWISRSKHAPKPEVHAEVLKLKKDNARLKMELDILKKAAVYFAQHVR